MVVLCVRVLQAMKKATLISFHIPNGFRFVCFPPKLPTLPQLSLTVQPTAHAKSNMLLKCVVTEFHCPS